MKRRLSKAVRPVLFLACAVLAGCGTIGATPEYRFGSQHTLGPPETAAVVPVLKADASLNEVLAFGAAMNEGLKSRFLKWQAALDRIPEAAGFPDPRFGYAYFLQEVETRVGPQQHKVSLSQAIPGLGKLEAKEELAARRAAVLQAEYEKAITDLYTRMRLLYANYYFLNRHKAITTENLARLQALEPVVSTAYKTGAAPYAALLRVQVRLSREQEELLTIDDRLEKAAFNLNALLSRPGETALPVPTLPALEDLPVFESDTALRGLLRRSNPQLAILKRKMEAADAMGDLAGKLDNPDIMLGADWVITDRSDMSVDDNGKDPLMFMVSFNIPLYRDKYDAALKAARSSLRAAAHKHHDAENMLMARLRSLLTDTEAAKRRIRLHDEDLLPKARQAFEVSRTAFRAGKAEYLQMLDALELVFDLELAREKQIVMRAENIYRVKGLLPTIVLTEGDVP